MVNQLQHEFDQSVVEKHSLEMELISMNERLKAATEMVERYGSINQSSVLRDYFFCVTCTAWKTHRGHVSIHVTVVVVGVIEVCCCLTLLVSNQ